MKDRIILFSKKEQCCACGACYNICPKKAISMTKDDCGFVYPQIDDSICIRCGACKRVCAFQNIEERNTVIDTFVAARRDTDKILLSASGGIFAVFAEAVLKENGIVFGSALVRENETLVPKHIGVEKIDDLPALFGSKYVQSAIGDTYKEVRVNLRKGRKVLFSGTPCQVAGLKAFLGKTYENLLTLDIICHGVPNADFFAGYLKILERKFSGKILDFKFRDKKNGWGPYTICALVKDNKTQSIKRKYFSIENSTYEYMFLRTEILRKNCYKCRYTTDRRSGDITIGDYWGIQKEHPELLKKNGGVLDETKGISVAIVNTEVGKIWLNECKNDLYLYKSSFEKAAILNRQLVEPSRQGMYRDRIMELYRHGGYNEVDKFYTKILNSNFKVRIKRIIPMAIKNQIKAILKIVK